MRTRKPCSPDTLFICRIQLAIADIFHDSAGKEHRILQNNAKRTAQIRFFYLVDINSVITDFAVRDIIKPVDQVCDRRLSGAGQDADLLLESAEQKIYDIRSGRDKTGVKTIKESILEVIDTMQKLSGADRDKFAGIPTGFNYLDTVLTGLGRSDLIILAARPGMGKTSFALNIATNVARQQKVPTIIFSLEMTCEQLTDRILSSTAWCITPTGSFAYTS